MDTLPSTKGAKEYGHISELVSNQDFEAVIREVRDVMDTDGAAALSNPVIAEWAGMRYRNLFLQECEQDESALRNAKIPLPLSLLDRRSTRELLAQRYFKRLPPDEVLLQMPAADVDRIENTTLLFAPGLLTGLLPVLAFESIWPQVQKRFGIDILASDSHPGRPCAENVSDIYNAAVKGIGIGVDTLEVRQDPPKEFMLMGYSKGAPDALNFLQAHPEIAPKVKAVVSWAGAVGGSYVADDVYKRVKDIPMPKMPLAGQVGRILRQMVPVVQMDRVSRRLDEYDVKAAMLDLTTHERDRWNGAYVEELNELNLPFFSMAGATSVLEVPYYQAMGVLQLNAYDKENDMQLVKDQTHFPLTNHAHLALFRGHHWDLSYDAFPWYTRMGARHVDHKFARYPAMAAMISLFAELGLIS